jgi:hypothetical protein
MLRSQPDQETRMPRQVGCLLLSATNVGTMRGGNALPGSRARRNMLLADSRHVNVLTAVTRPNLIVCAELSHYLLTSARVHASAGWPAGH